MPPRETPRSQLPTIGHYREHGLPGIRLYCRGTFCSRSFRISFDDLALPDTVVLIEIPKAMGYRFVCSSCGSRDVEVRADWPNPLKPKG